MLCEVMADGAAYTVKDLRDRTRQPEAWLKENERQHSFHTPIDH